MGKARSNGKQARGLPEPVQVVRGKILRHADRTELMIEALALEILTSDTIPSGSDLIR